MRIFLDVLLKLLFNVCLEWRFVNILLIYLLWEEM